MATDTAVNDTTEQAPGAQTTTDAAAKMAHEFVDRVARVARESEDRIRQTANSAESSLQQTLNAARNKTSEAGDSVSDFVRQHPFAALGIAFGTGVLLSYLTRGSKAVRHDDTD
jgi:ElaB/YqjD/DUF883 family membrane-anchored ribosome-binding protein